MNKIYKLKLNKQTQELMVVSELASNYIARTDSASEQGSLSNYALLSNLLDSLKAEASEAKTLRVTPVSNFIFNTTCRALGSTGAYLAGIGLLTVAGSASALTGANVVSGDVAIAKNGSVTTITNSPSSIINWESFNIGKYEIVKFIQQSANSAVLNRVLGKQASEILGSLQSNGRVFLINPNGILFGKSATVNVAELVASTLDITNEDFTAGRYVFNQEKDTTIASVLNQGMIQVNDDGSLALIGGNVLNNGVLQARNGSIYLLAGKSITIADLDNPLISYKVSADNKAINIGSIISKNVNLLGGKVAHGVSGRLSYADIFTAANATENKDLDIKVTATGEVELFAGSTADQFQTNQQSNAEVVGEKQGLVVSNATIAVNGNGEQAGKVRLLGDYVATEANSAIYAAGGTVFVGGDTQGKGTTKLAQVTRQQQTSVINVSNQGNAGTAIVWGNYLYADGRIEAKSVTGKGGFVETSGKGLRLAETLVISTESNKGRAYYGTWLIDPVNAYIYHSDDQKPSTATGPNNPDDPLVIPAGTAGNSVFKSGLANDVYIKDTVITTRLETSWVTITVDNTIKALPGTSIKTSSKGNHLVLQAGTSIILDNATFNLGSFRAYAPEIQVSNGSSITVSSYNKLIELSANNSLVVDSSTIQGLNDAWNRIDLKTTNDSGTIKIINSQVSLGNGSNGWLKVHAKGDLSVSNSTFNSGKTLEIRSTGGMAKVDKLTVIASSTVNIDGKTVNLDKSSVQGAGVTIKGMDGDLSLDSSCVTSSKGVAYFAKDGKGGNLKLINTTTVTTSGNIDANATKSVTVDKSNTKSAGSVIFSGTSITHNNSATSSQGAKTELKATSGDITVFNATLEATKDVFVCATGQVKVLDSKLNSTTNSTLVTASTILNITNSTVGAFKDVILAGSDIQLNSTTFTSYDESTAAEHAIRIGGSSTKKITATTSTGFVTKGFSDVIFSAEKSVDIPSDVLTAGRDLGIYVSEGPLALVGKTYTAGRSVTLTGSEIDISGSLVTATTGTIDATVEETGKLKVEESNLTAGQKILLSTNGKVNLSGSNLSAGTGFESYAAETDLNGSVINITQPGGGSSVNSFNDLCTTSSKIITKSGDIVFNTSQGCLSLDSVSAIGAEVTAFASTKGVTITSTTVTASKGINISSIETAELITGNTFNSQTGIKISSEQEGLEFSESAFVSATGGVQVQAKNAINTYNSNFTGVSVDVESLCSTVTITSDLDDGVSSLVATSDLGHINVVGQGKVSIDEGTEFFSNGSVKLESKGADLDIQLSEVRARNGLVELKSQDELKLVDIKVTGVGVKLTSTNSAVSMSTAEHGTIIDGTTGKVEVQAHTKVAINEATKIKGKGDISLASAEAEIEVEQSNITSTGGTVKLVAPGAISTKNSNISGHSIDINSTTDAVTITKANLISTLATGLTKIHAKSEVNIAGSKVVGGSLDLASKKDSVLIVDKSQLEATGGDAKVKAPENILLESGSKFKAKQDLKLYSDNASISVLGTNLESTAGTVNVTAKEEVTLVGSNLSAINVILNSTNASVITAADQNSVATTIEAKGSVTANGDQEVVLGNGTKVNALANIELGSTNGSLSVVGSNLSSTAGTVSLGAKENISISNSNISGQDVNINTANSTLTSIDSSLAGSNSITFNAKEDVSVENTSAFGGRIIATTANGSIVTSKKTSLDAKTGNFNANANKDIKLGVGTKLNAGGDLSLEAKQNISIATAKLSTGGANTITAHGNLSITDSNASARGAVKLTAKDQLTILNSNISGKHVLATANEILSNYTTFTVNGGGIKLAAVEGMDVDHDFFMTKFNLVEFDTTDGLTHVTNSNASARAVEVKGAEVYEFNNNWTKVTRNADLTLADAKEDEVREDLDLSRPEAERDKGRDLAAMTVLQMSEPSNSQPNSALNAGDSSRTEVADRRNDSEHRAGTRIGARGNQVESRTSNNSPTPITRSRSPLNGSGSSAGTSASSNNRSRVRRSTDDKGTAIPVASGINSCSVGLVDLYNKYQVDSQDREQLSLVNNIDKYQIELADLKETAEVCKDLDLVKLLKQIRKPTVKQE